MIIDLKKLRQSGKASVDFFFEYVPESGLIDINGDGLNDYITESSVLYGFGNQFANYDKNQFTTENISKSSIEASAFSLSLGTGYGSSDSNITPYTQDEDGNPTNSSYIGCSGTISVSGSSSSSDIYTTSMFLDINGDGLVYDRNENGENSGVDSNDSEGDYENE